MKHLIVASLALALTVPAFAKGTTQHHTSHKATAHHSTKKATSHHKTTKVSHKTSKARHIKHHA